MELHQFYNVKDRTVVEKNEEENTRKRRGGVKREKGESEEGLVNIENKNKCQRCNMI